MANQKIRGKDLKKIKYTSNKSMALAIDIISKHFKHETKDKKIEILTHVKSNPEQYLEDDMFRQLAEELIPEPELKPKKEIALKRDSGDFNVFGRKLITSNAYQQMELAMRLPIAEKGAMMPDAHHGYGLPIGGVLATKNAVIPYGVGLDIGCRMSLSIYDIGDRFLKKHSYKFKTALKEKTNFGTGGSLNIKQEHEILDRPTFKMTPLLSSLHGKAIKQLGTSGSGNHFVEFGLVQLNEENIHGLKKGNYVGLLAHSGSRGFGANIARYYTDLATELCHLPRQAQHLAWLDLDTEAGQEYWLSMNLAGDYAKACHDQIHSNLSKHLGIEKIALIENHHNFAWKEVHNGEELIVHRKGATPASKGTLGIIPGSMATDGYIVRGKGNIESLESASHGAGRKMSRKMAKESFTGSDMRKALRKNQVTLIGGGIDETPLAYKNLDEVMRYQTELVDVVGKFTPRIVRMDKN